jgi:phytol kinase
VIAGSIALASYFTPILPGINSVGRQSWGTFFYAVSVGVLAAYFWQIQQPEYAAIGILIMAWGDGLAALVGQHWGRHPYQVLGMRKSWEGSLTMGAVSFLVSCCILSAVQGSIWQTWAVSLAVALAATGLESFSQWGLDNLLVPLGSAALTFLLNRAI